MTRSRIFWGIAAPVSAISIALLFASGILLLQKANPIETFQLLFSYGFQPRNIVSELNQAAAYYLAGIAAAIGFKMLLFNIGIDGQYRLAVFFAAVVGGAVTLPPVLHVLLIIVVAVTVGGAWAAISGYLKIKYGVSEVISSIMLNFIAAGLISYLLNPMRLGSQAEGSQNVATPTIPESGRLPTIEMAGGQLYTYIFFAALVGVGYWILISKTVFGFNLRATGISFRAALSSGVNAPRMIFVTMVLSGATAGLVGIGTLLSDTYNYSLSFPSGYALTGLALALLGRNHPIGIAFAAFFWAFLERSAGILDLNGIPTEIVTMMQGTIVISIVVAYELIRRLNLRQQQQAVGSHQEESKETEK
jgi:general nucleoside transport system permease protein